MRILAYLVTIVIANVLTANLLPFKFGPFLIPAGTFLIGATFIFRDFVQEKYGRNKTYGVIGAALIISGVTSYILGDTLLVLVASAISFALSETTDTEIYSRLRLPIKLRVFWSGTVGGMLDSVVFVIIGLSPLGAGFVPWEFVPMAILGQILVKVAMQAFALAVINLLPNRFVSENV